MAKNLPANAGDTGLIPGLGSTCCGATKAQELQLLSQGPGAREPQPLSLRVVTTADQEVLPQCEACAPLLEKVHAKPQRLSAAKTPSWIKVSGGGTQALEFLNAPLVQPS